MTNFIINFFIKKFRKTQEQLPIIPVSPTLTKAKLSEVALNWPSYPGAISYEYQIADNPQFNNAQTFQTSLTNVSIGDGVQENSDFYFRYRVNLINQNTNWVNYSLDGFIQIEPPILISVLSVNADAGNEEAWVTWEIDGDISGYTGVLIELTDLNGSTTIEADYTGGQPYNLTNLVNEREYAVSITPNLVSIDYILDTTNNFTIFIPNSNLVLLNSVTGVLIQNNTANDPETELLHTWNTNDADATSTRVERRSFVNDEWTSWIEVYNDSSETFVDTGLINDVLYQYRYQNLDSTETYLPSEFVTISVTKTSQLNETVDFESFGANGNGQFFVNSLKTIPLQNGNTQIEYLGQSDVFLNTNVNDVCCIFRSTRTPIDYPSNGRNYFPGVITSVHSEVVEIIDGKNIIVNYLYNGGNLDSPQEATNLSGYVGFDNWQALVNMMQDGSRPETVLFKRNAFYITRGYPNTAIAKNTYLKTETGVGENAILYLAHDDAFGFGGFVNNFHNTTFKGLPRFLKRDNTMPNFDFIFENLDLCPPVFRMSGFQGFDLGDSLFHFGFKQNSYHKTMGLISCNTKKISQLIELNNGVGFEDASNAMPDLFAQSYDCGLEGEINGKQDVVQHAVLKIHDTDYDGVSLSKYNYLRKAGIIYDFKGLSKRIQISENFIPKAVAYRNVLLFFENEQDFSNTTNTHLLIEGLNDDFNWYMVSNQYFNGGLNNHRDKLVRVWIQDLEVNLILGNTDDWRPIYNGMTAINNYYYQPPTRVRSIHKIPEINDVISKYNEGTLANPGNPGFIQKISNTVWHITGWHILIGDTFIDSNNEVYTVVNRGHIGNRPSGYINNISRYIITFNKPITSSIDDVSLTYQTSVLADYMVSNSFQALCDVTYRGDFNTNDGGSRHGHMFYIQNGVNFDCENVDFLGYWRSSGTLELSNIEGPNVEPDTMMHIPQIVKFKNCTNYGGGLGREYHPPTNQRGINVINEGPNTIGVFNSDPQGENIIEFKGSNIVLGQTFTAAAHYEPNAEGLTNRIYEVEMSDCDFDPLVPQTFNQISARRPQTIKFTNMLWGNNQNIRILSNNVIIDLSGVTSVVSSNGRRWGLVILNTSNEHFDISVSIIGNNGMVPILNQNPALDSPEKLSIQLTNWQTDSNGDLYPHHNTNKFLSLGFNIDAPDFDTYISVTDENGDPVTFTNTL
jgi:hypothetical protein